MNVVTRCELDKGLFIVSPLDFEVFTIVVFRIELIAYQKYISQELAFHKFAYENNANNRLSNRSIIVILWDYIKSKCSIKYYFKNACNHF